MKPNATELHFENLLQLITSILDISKIEAGRVRLVLSDVDATQIMRDAVATVLPLARKKGLKVACEAGAMPRIQADRDKLRQCLVNLCSNAVKFTPAGGTIKVSAEPLPGDPVIGLRSLEDGYVPPILDVGKLDRKLLVTNAESVAGVRALLEREAIFAGVSSGAVVHVGHKLAEELDDGVVVCVLADGGWKYLSAPFWAAEDVEEAMEKSVWW